MTAAITFDYTAWITRYPEFVNISTQDAQAYFDDAGLYQENVACNPAFGITVYNNGAPVPLLSKLLNMLTAHIAWLNAMRDSAGNPSSTGTMPAPSTVGRISNAAEGSVNVALEYDSSGSPSEAFFTQTKYGAAYWAATAQFRTFRYAAQPTIVPFSGFPLYRRRF